MKQRVDVSRFAQAGVVHSVESGGSTKIFRDHWLPDSDNSRIETVPPQNLLEAIVDQIWDIECNGDRSLIYRVPLSLREEEDVWFWHRSPDGGYSVKTGYQTLRSSLVYNRP
ncbi:hypothetical protein LguiA_007772 [Lonicera macranthoides]